MKRRIDGLRRQHGAATLTVCLMLLFVFSIMSLYTARLSNTELQLSNNEYRHRQAQEAAMAGLEQALDTLSPEHLARREAMFRGPAGILPDGSRYVSSLRPRSERLVEIIATGHAADGGSPQQLHQLAVFLPYLSRSPPAALSARQAVHLGADRVEHDNGGVRLWNGGPLFLAGQPVTTGGTSCTVTGLCPADSRLAVLSSDDWPAQFFTMPLELLREAATPLPNNTAATGGGLLLMDNARSAPVSLRHTRIGSPETPAILVITGDVVEISDSRIYGLLYIGGKFNGDVHGLSLQGALIADGKVDIGSDFDIRYDTKLMKLLSRLGRFSKLPGSWHDF